MTEEKIARLYELLVASRKRRLAHREIQEAQECLERLPETPRPGDFWARTDTLNRFEIDLYCMG